MRGLESGADDYVTKPFVLIARVGAVLRRLAEAQPDENAQVQVHEIAIDPGRHSVTVAGAPVELTFTEFRTLHFLARRPGWMFTRSQIIDAVRGADYIVTDRTGRHLCRYTTDSKAVFSIQLRRLSLCLQNWWPPSGSPPGRNHGTVHLRSCGALHVDFF